MTVNIPIYQREFVLGVRDELPILLGVAPFGMIYGLLAISAGLPISTAQAMSTIVFAGSAQFMTIQMINTGTPALVLIFTAFIINLRHALYSASIAPYIKPLKRSWKIILAYLLTDEAYIVAITRYNKNDNSVHKHWYFLGAGLALWVCWQICTAIGIFLGAQIPANLPLDYALPLTFIALVVPALKNRSDVFAAIIAGIIAMFTYSLPFKLGLIVAGLAGIFVGMISERK